MSYKNYRTRRIARKGPKPDDIACCPTRIPIIGPILFSLLIFSPYFLPSSERDQSQDPESEEQINPFEPTFQEGRSDEIHFQDSQIGKNEKQDKVEAFH